MIHTSFSSNRLKKKIPLDFLWKVTSLSFDWAEFEARAESLGGGVQRSRQQKGQLVQDDDKVGGMHLKEAGGRNQDSYM